MRSRRLALSLAVQLGVPWLSPLPLCPLGRGALCGYKREGPAQMPLLFLMSLRGPLGMGPLPRLRALLEQRTLRLCLLALLLLPRRRRQQQQWPLSVCQALEEL